MHQRITEVIAGYVPTPTYMHAQPTLVYSCLAIDNSSLILIYTHFDFYNNHFNTAELFFFTTSYLKPVSTLVEYVCTSSQEDSLYAECEMYNLCI